MRPFIETLCNKHNFTEIISEQIPLADFLEQLQQIFLPYFSQAYLDENLVLPETFLIYLETVKGSLDYWQYGNIEQFGDSADVLQFIDYFYRYRYPYPTSIFLKRKSENAPYPNDTIWLQFGEYRPKHEHGTKSDGWIICCDKSHPDFGKVFLYDEDTHPWQNQDFRKYRAYSSFMEFILKEFA
jgi:hypothetical protein